MSFHSVLGSRLYVVDLKTSNIIWIKYDSIWNVRGIAKEAKRSIIEKNNVMVMEQ